MSARRAALGVLLLAGSITAVSCGVHSPLTVEISIPITVSSLSTSSSHALEGFVQGYVFTPTSGGSGGSSPAPMISQTPTPPTGYGVTTAAVVVTIPSVSSANTRLDQGAFFAFRGFPADSTPVNVMVDFTGGGYPSFSNDVPIVPRDMAGLALQQVDLDKTTQYRNNAGDIRSKSGCLMNFTIASSEAARFRLFAAANGDLTTSDLLDGDEASLLLDWDMLAGETRTITDQRPLEEGGLLRLATPGDGNRMFHLYLVTQTRSDPVTESSGSITGLTLNFKARVSAPL